MYFTKFHGESHVQLTIRIPRRWGFILNRLRKAGKHESLNCLVYSILAEIVADELASELDDTKNSSAQQSISERGVSQ